MTTSPGTQPAQGSSPADGDVKRPVAVVVATVLAMFSALLFLTQAITTIVGGAFGQHAVLSSLPEALLTIVAVIAGLSTLRGNDFARSIRTGIGSAALVFGAISVINIVTSSGEGTSLSGPALAIEVMGLCNGIVGIGIMLTLSSPAIDRWTRAQDDAAAKADQV